jgi:hypothetical protein
MSCKDCRVEIEETEQGQSLSAASGAHLAACAECRAFRDERLALRQMIASLEVVTAPADFDFRLRARLAAAKSDGDSRFALSRFTPGAWSMALAASFVLLVALGLVVNQAWFSTRTQNTSLAVVGNAAPVNVSAPTFAPARNDAPKIETPSIVEVNHSASPSASSRVETARRTVETREAATTSRSGSEVVDNDFIVRRPPPIYTPLGIPDPSAQPTTLSIPVQASMKPTTIMLNDRQAKPHNVSLRSVTFGGQDVFEQDDAQKMFVKTAQSIW